MKKTTQTLGVSVFNLPQQERSLWLQRAVKLSTQFVRVKVQQGPGIHETLKGYLDLSLGKTTCVSENHVFGVTDSDGLEVHVVTVAGDGYLFSLTCPFAFTCTSGFHRKIVYGWKGAEVLVLTVASPVGNRDVGIMC